MNIRILGTLPDSFEMIKEILKDHKDVYIGVKGFLVWNQGLVNLGFDYYKARFGTNDYISSVIRQEDFQNGNHKDKIKLNINQ